jgi:hypothetical protein
MYVAPIVLVLAWCGHGIPLCPLPTRVKYPLLALPKVWHHSQNLSFFGASNFPVESRTMTYLMVSTILLVQSLNEGAYLDAPSRCPKSCCVGDPCLGHLKLLMMGPKSPARMYGQMEYPEGVRSSER